MGKSKRSPALFEVIQRRQLQESTSGFPLPKWWRSSKGNSPNYPPVNPPDLKPSDRENIIKLVPQLEKPVGQQSVPVSTPPKVEPPRASTPAGGDTAGSGSSSAARGGATAGSSQGPPVVRLGGGRIQFSLNPVSLAILFGVILMLGIGAYQVGKGFGNLGPAKDDFAQANGQKDEIAKARAGNADPSVTDVPRQDRPENRRLEGSRTEAGIRNSRASSGTPAKDDGQSRPKSSVTANPPAPKTVEAKASPENQRTVEAPSPTGRTKGLNYVWIVRFRTDNRDDAAHARKWLSDKGINTSVEERDGSLFLVSESGFDYGNADDKARSQALQGKLKQLSPSYLQQCRTEQRDRLYSFDKPEVRKERE